MALFFAGARKDDLGRTMAQVEDADNRIWIQGALLDAGAARVSDLPGNGAPARAMLAHEAAARRARRGLWTIPQYEVRLPDEIGPGEDGFIVVEGRIRRIGEGREGLYLDFNDRWWETVSLAVPKAALADFRAAGLDLYDLQDRLIRARGVVRNGRLAIDHPEQIEILRG